MRRKELNKSENEVNAVNMLIKRQKDWEKDWDDTVLKLKKLKGIEKIKIVPKP